MRQHNVTEDMSPTRRVHAIVVMRPLRRLRADETLMPNSCVLARTRVKSKSVLRAGIPMISTRALRAIVVVPPIEGVRANLFLNPKATLRAIVLMSSKASVRATTRDMKPRLRLLAKLMLKTIAFVRAMLSVSPVTVLLAIEELTPTTPMRAKGHLSHQETSARHHEFFAAHKEGARPSVHLPSNVGVSRRLLSVTQIPCARPVEPCHPRLSCRAECSEPQPRKGPAMPNKPQVLTYIQARVDAGQSAYQAAEAAFEHFTNTAARSHSCLRDVLGHRAFYDFYLRSKDTQRDEVITETTPDDVITTAEPNAPQINPSGRWLDPFSMQFITASGLMKFGDMTRVDCLSSEQCYLGQVSALRRRGRLMHRLAGQLEDDTQTIRQRFTRAQAIAIVKELNG